MLDSLVIKDGAFCYTCRLFGNFVSASSSRPEQAFTKNGFRDWKHTTGAKEILASHNSYLSHKEALIAWGQFQSTSQRGSVAEQLESIPMRNIGHVTCMLHVDY